MSRPRRREVLTNTARLSVHQIVVAEDRETLPSQGGDSGLVVLNVQRQRGASVGSDEQRISIVDVDLGAEQRFANVCQRLPAFRKLDDQQVALGDWQMGLFEYFAG